ncbi:hypothetical protein LguiB_025665 [Lonicera macranthoides]
MGQAFRRASGRIRSSTFDTPSPSPSPSPHLKKAADSTQPPPAVPIDKVPTDSLPPDSDDAPRVNAENVLEDRDPRYDSMLNQMVGRIQAKPGGKLEMGEASVVDKYKRPLPKLRNTTVESGRYEERSVPPGTLNVAQLRHIILLHEGKAEDHNGPMDVNRIAEKFRIDVAQVQRIVKFISLPPEGSSSKPKNNGQ